MIRASKGEQQMRSVVHRLRSEAKEMEEVQEALQQRVKALQKENAYTLEQLQMARKTEREQKTTIANLRSKLQLVQSTQEEVDRLANECKDVKQQLIRSNHDRDIFSASNNHLKEELAEVTKSLHQTKVAKAQMESDFGTNCQCFHLTGFCWVSVSANGANYVCCLDFRLQEEIKKGNQLSESLSMHQKKLQESTTLIESLQTSLSAIKEEFATTVLRFEQTKRHLEDQLIEEERAREELQEQNLDFRKMNKKLLKDIEQKEQNGDAIKAGVHGSEIASHSQHPSAVSAAEMKGIARKKLDDLSCQLEWAQMRENDLLGLLGRQATAVMKKPPVQRKLSRMPSTTVITRYVVAGDSGNSSIAVPSRQGRSGGVYNRNNEDQSDDDIEPGDNEDKFDTEFAGNAIEIDEKNFEVYHQEVHRMLTEIEQGQEKHQKQQKVIAVGFI